MNSMQHEGATGALERAAELRQGSSVPLGVGNFEEQIAGPLAGEHAGGRRINTGSVLIVIVLLVAGAGLVSMRHLARVTIPEAGATELERTIEQFLKVVTPGDSSNGAELFAAPDDSVLAVLNEEYTAQQVPLAQVQRDPFIIFQRPSPQPTDDQPRNSAELLFQQRRADRELEIRRAGEKLVLKSVLTGSTSMANLNDKIVREGEPMLVQPENIEFTVTSITGDSVRLTSSDERYELTVELVVPLRRD